MIIADITLADVGPKNFSVVYRWPPRPANAPVLIHLHGGAMVRGKKNREAIPLLYRLASHGWICISANYRLYPEAGFPDPLIDVKKVIAWVRTHGTEYAADTRTLFVVGGSAGAQLAAQAAMTQNNKTLQPGFETADTSMTAAVLLYGYYGWSESESWKRIQVSDYALPPVFMIHGDHDTLTPVEDARAFAEKLRAISNNPVVLAELPGAQHSFDLFHSIRNEAAIDAIEYFAAWVRSNQRGNRAGSAGA